MNRPAKTLHLGLPLSLYHLARRMMKMHDGLEAVETMLSAAYSTGIVEPDQLRLIARLIFREKSQIARTVAPKG